jgi:hypothetical protein
VSELYDPLIATLAKRSIEAYFQSSDQLVLSTQKGPVMPFGGNSFWISLKQGCWYLSTWAPVCYEVPPATDLPSLCAEFAAFGRCALAVVPKALVDKYCLRELDENEFDRVFEENDEAS